MVIDAGVDFIFDEAEAASLPSSRRCGHLRESCWAVASLQQGEPLPKVVAYGLCACAPSALWLCSCRRQAHAGLDAALTEGGQTSGQVLGKRIAFGLIGVVGCGDAVTDCMSVDAGSGAQVTANFDAQCFPMIRRDTSGAVLDAHEATIEVFEGRYYLYGTSFGCGFVWQRAGTPFCGFRSYSSPDMIHWTDNGPLFDATTRRWQERCGCYNDRCGCFRPHVKLNAATRRYVLWFNGNDVPSSYHVLTSRSPSGPFQELDERDAQRVAVNADGQLRIPNNGDPSMFVDDDAIAYLSYTDWQRGGDLIIERLNASYTRGTGEYVRLGMTHVEAPAMFKRGATYYLTYSDPNCGLCAGTGTSARSSPSPLGPWSAPIKLSDDSCGGQPSHVTRVVDKLGAETFIYQSDLWDPAGKGDQRKANHYWGPLEFEGRALLPIRCLRDFSVPVLDEQAKRRWSRGWQSDSASTGARPVSYRPIRDQL